MRSWLANYELRSARSLAEALDVLAASPGEWTPLAGGTDLMVLLEAGTLRHRKLLDIWTVPELRGVTVTDDAVRIGALCTYTDLLRDPVLTAEFPLVGAAARETGAVAIQNRGTVGGNIANASPAADLPPALLVYDAALELVSAAGTRRRAYQGFHTDYKKMDLRPGELIAAVVLPRVPSSPRRRQVYRKVGTRRAQAISKICFAALDETDDAGAVREIRLAFGSVAPTVKRAEAAEAAVRGREKSDAAVAAAVEALATDLAPIDDIRSTAAYRLRVARNLLREFLA